MGLVHDTLPDKGEFATCTMASLFVKSIDWVENLSVGFINVWLVTPRKMISLQPTQQCGWAFIIVV
jgi:hypothetical protein